MRIVAITAGADREAAALLRALEEHAEVRRLSPRLASGGELHRTAAAIAALEPALGDLRPAAVLVAGDGVAALTGALVGVKLGMPLIRLGAGVRSGDRHEPAEVNRAVTDLVCDLLLCTDDAGLSNLEREGLGERAKPIGDPTADPGAAVDAILAWLEACTPPA